MDVTKPYKFIGFGAMGVAKPHKFIGLGAMDATKPYKFIRFGANLLSLLIHFHSGSTFNDRPVLWGDGYRPVVRSRSHWHG